MNYSQNHRLAEAYLTAREHVVANGYAGEIDWQESRSIHRVTETEFLREAAWVVLSAGMAEAVIKRVFPAISCAFCSWKSAADIVSQSRYCEARARLSFDNPAKVRAILDIAATVASNTFFAFRDRLIQRGPSLLCTLPFIGPVTCLHLAKNLGLDVVKPDRHLVRMAKAAGMSDPAVLCEQIALVTGDCVATIDVVLWRYATLNRCYEELFKEKRASHKAIAVLVA
jgi:hypothetical protein